MNERSDDRLHAQRDASDDLVRDLLARVAELEADTTKLRAILASPSGHHPDCAWQLDQYDFECDCGAVALQTASVSHGSRPTEQSVSEA
jgi:hypothetical protein